MGDWSAGYVEANEIRLHYTRTGGFVPSVVLAHGVTDDGLCWAPLAQALAPEYDLVTVDARGHGRSDAPEGGYGPAEQAADLAEQLSFLLEGAMARAGLEGDSRRLHRVRELALQLVDAAPRGHPR